VENTSLMMYRRWGLRQDVIGRFERAAYFDVNGISGRSLADKSIPRTNAGILNRIKHRQY